MKKIICKYGIPVLFSILLICPKSSFAQDDTSNYWMIKAYPVLTELKLNGGILAVERTVDTQSFGLYAELKYFGGRDIPISGGGTVNHPPYYRLELQGRWYPGRLNRAFYLAPSISLNDRFEPAFGALIGAQKLIKDKIPIDFNMGFQTTTPTYNFDTLLILTLKLGLGIAFKTN